MSEHRSEVRQRVFLKGRIVFNNGCSTIDCLVRDMSARGARLALSETAALPDVFDLYIPQKDRTYRANLCWRREDGVGVTFPNETAGAAPAPAAAAIDPAADASLTLLLRRVNELEAENAALRRILTSMAQPTGAVNAA